MLFGSYCNELELSRLTEQIEKEKLACLANQGGGRNQQSQKTYILKRCRVAECCRRKSFMTQGGILHLCSSGLLTFKFTNVSFC
ncbi:hypothetical protein P8452_69892 [Trifolium repens]|nr:hypothetical protein P8452_69892 [Trifolium repens]